MDRISDFIRHNKRTVLYCVLAAAVLIIVVVIICVFVFGSDSGASRELTEFEKIIVDAHNKYRKMHGCPPLEINVEISKYAEEWAQENAENKKMQHRPQPTKYGENIHMGMRELAGPEQAVKSWYSEIKDYNYDDAKFTMETGHFTQVIWKSSKELGCGLAVGEDGFTYVVCNYKPHGNMPGAFVENVPKLIA